MNHKLTLTYGLLIAVGLMGLASCTTPVPELDSPDTDTLTSPTPDEANETITASQGTTSQERSCILVEDGFGSPGQVAVQAQEVVSGLEVPWGIIFLSETDMLVSERPGRIRLVRDGQLQPTPVATVDAVEEGEGGLLGIAAHPDFDNNRLFYLYYTTNQGGSLTNRVERWQLSSDRTSASPDRIILDNIPVARFHNGGRLRFGPDGMLYIGTGDARKPQISQDVNSLAGKILRLTPDGEIPGDNPFPGNPVFLKGIRNTQGFDWYNESTLWVTDHGPSGELGRSGHDKVSVANPGDNLGWPTLHACQDQEGMVPASITWRQAVPPGGAAIYRGNAIAPWQGSLLIGALGARHLHRVTFNPDSPYQVQSHEVYFQNELGRLREVIMGPDGELYVTTSNCDGRGNCPPEQDKIVRITNGQ